MSIPLIALKPHRYDGRLWRKGQTLLARSADDALVLTTLGVAVRADAPQSSVKEYWDKQLSPDHTGHSAVLSDGVKYEAVKRPRGRPRKNTYSTRALTAVDLDTTAVVEEAQTTNGSPDPSDLPSDEE